MSSSTVALVILIHLHLYEEEKGIFFDISQFGSGEELLEKLYERDMIFDLLFLDDGMKKLTGLETAERIRQSDAMSACSIVFVTAADDHDQFMQVRPLQVIGKPVTKECIDAILDKVLAKKGVIASFIFYITSFYLLSF